MGSSGGRGILMKPRACCGARSPVFLGTTAGKWARMTRGRRATGPVSDQEGVILRHRGRCVRGNASEEAETRTVSDENGKRDDGNAEADRALTSLLSRPASRRRVTSCDCAEEGLYELLMVAQEGGYDNSAEWSLRESSLERLVEMIVEDGNPDLAVDLFRVVYGGSRSQLPFKWIFDASRFRSFVLVCLIRSLYLENALKFLEDSCKVSMPGPDQVSFGTVVPSPSAPSSSLTVVKSFHGEETVACASSRYLFDCYSGMVVSAESDAPASRSEGAVFELLEKRVFAGNSNKYALNHKIVVDAPDGTARAYKFATETDELPAKVGDRVTVICASNSESAGGSFPPIPPGSFKGEPKSLYNHRQRKTTQLLRTFDPNSGVALKWIVLGTALLAGGDSSSALINPDFPALIAAGALGVTAAGAAAKELILPQLAKLPTNTLASAELRQEFLQQYDVIIGKLDELLVSINEDIQLLGRLWGLHHKIEALGSSGSYDARLQKILGSASTLEDRVASKLQLIEGYSRVSHMIEIEVELDADIDAAETRVAMSGITVELGKVEELEELKDEWTMQVEAKDEIERLLGSSDQL
ncbi:hypothetical protein HOP50_05g36970 [Chloropicon primus]|uniref:Uncharacterized protein n=1 Tax=Chloropicon primus TaxID=1764295 RepID=A0A5B8MLI2_9CHLO|nr:hypothetical protein A3770_05p36890 [Chloropicon primus]UPR00383.1 hypothetical protein HOP50_05g36970 [Chloropicon primus]|mmetsp:Transcript_19/g.52  ORF Transcript_19/g.52 Transcript_19/m.52 type:complete len:586 (+) Transcript_19:628-2385(+)|eukprot:QDZ21171.1 hypothetical protein A3770_05p36890 [Chloropicon primus]